MDLILGTAQFDSGYGRFRQHSVKPHPRKFLQRAWKLGVRALDTAPAYDDAEEVIGKSGWAGEVHTKFRAGSPLDESLSFSLQRLNRDFADVVYFHDPDVVFWEQQFFSDVRRRFSRDLVRRLGVSIYSPDQFKRALEINEIEVVQLPLNIADGRFSQSLFRAAQQRNTRVIARSVFLQGAILQSPRNLPEQLVALRPITEALAQASRDFGVSPATIATAWIKRFAHLDGLILGVDSYAQLEENIQSAGRFEIAEDLFDELRRLQINDAAVLDPRLWSTRPGSPMRPRDDWGTRTTVNLD